MGNPISLTRTGIAWESDKKYKFQNPEVPAGYTDLADYLKKETASPPAWGKKLWELDSVTANDSNNGLLNEDLIVWMRTAAFPNFRKLYRKIEKTENSSKLAKGNYKLSIEYNYRVDQFAGTKSIYLSQTSILGKKSLFGSDLYRCWMHLPFNWHCFSDHSPQIWTTDKRYDGHGPKKLNKKGPPCFLAVKNRNKKKSIKFMIRPNQNFCL